MASPRPSAPPPSAESHAPSGPVGALALGALGVVFGDIGTSPLYTLQVAIAPAPGAGPDRADVLGVLSLIVWALTMVVTVKYLAFVMRANNRGEGGILALLALVPEPDPRKRRARIGLLTLLVVAGAALLYGDGIITPAISVLSALEGVQLAAPGFKSAVVPVTCFVLLALFAIQRRGTGGLGKVFGPVMLLWFLTIGVLGAWHVAKNPEVLAAISPRWGALYFVHHGWFGFAILGVVVLAVTGGEALYADMGHFGARPIRLAWYGLVFPSLVLCYLGQAALLLRDPSAMTNPFFAMVPTGAATYALVALATAATIIASQSLITGVFSLTHQAVQLGLFPRVTVTHTSHETEGQIYVPEMNWALCVACIALVLSFRESARLAAAYGIAVSGTMGITSYVYFVVTRRTWGWPMWKALPPLLLFLSFDLPFFGANLLKFWDGGWIPIVVAAAMLVIMVDWKVGRRVLNERITEQSPPLKDFLAELERYCPLRIPGAAIFLASNPEWTPPVLFTHARRIRALREKLVLLTVTTEHVPYVDREDRLSVEDLGKGVFRVIARAGFMETPNVPRLLAEAKLPIDLEDATYFLGRETFLAGKGGKMGVFSEGLFAFLSRNARSATSWFGIPPDQVVELGMQLDL
ncbi:MAG TPA: KUP/HAK/KT family potassium transporter [Polyangiaceae bacterium]